MIKKMLEIIQSTGSSRCSLSLTGVCKNVRLGVGPPERYFGCFHQANWFQLFRVGPLSLRVQTDQLVKYSLCCYYLEFRRKESSACSSRIVRPCCNAWTSSLFKERWLFIFLLKNHSTINSLCIRAQGRFLSPASYSGDSGRKPGTSALAIDVVLSFNLASASMERSKRKNVQSHSAFQTL